MQTRSLEKIIDIGILPVIRAPSADVALRLVEALREGEIPIAEVTMTVPGAVTLLATLKARFGGSLLVGAGTVRDIETARACLDAGAEFVVCPIFDPATVAFCIGRGVPVLPGALTPSEILACVRSGAELIKVFPCGALGGASYIRSLKGPLPEVRLVPTGGVSLETVGDFFRAGATAVGVGTDLVDVGAILEGRADIVTARAGRYVEAVKTARGERS